MAGGYTCVGCGVVWLVIGLFIAIGGPFLIPLGLNSALNDYLVVDSEVYHSLIPVAQIIINCSFRKARNMQIGQEAMIRRLLIKWYLLVMVIILLKLIQVFYMWNLTNADDWRLNGAKPIYESKGPYIYRRNRTVSPQH